MLWVAVVGLLVGDDAGLVVEVELVVAGLLEVDVADLPAAAGAAGLLVDGVTDLLVAGTAGLLVADGRVAAGLGVVCWA
ncbi:hypothetical protein [Hymenobacter volaticus]|uniref:Uncharacterized protein n=1 Tax=Hymenobacter volaticus TaxID=2932254 RepID=A0ABY4GAU9_9BACT|nr:hypothetical protein [Hymenobacter volaticus]UOQ67882.1 hypothetical protein MUN86_08495 [Hymenobacter volaticus]